LCTAGFGMATGKWYFLLGALYLFFINSLFICLATFLIVKHLRFHKKEFPSKSIEKRVVRSIWLIVILTIIPSIYLAYKIVERSIFESNAKNFVQKEFRFSKTQVVNRNYKIEGTQKSVELLVIGQELSAPVLDSLRQRMPLYRLDSNTKLIVHQGLNAKQEIDMAQIKASILEDVFKEERPSDTTISIPTKMDLPIPDLRLELKSLYPGMEHYSLTQSVFHRLDSTHLDTVSLLTVRFTKPLPADDRLKLQNWVKQRIKSDSVKLVLE